MRVYEIARQAGVTSAEVMKAAAEAEIEAFTAISAVESAEAEALLAKLKGRGGSGVEERRAHLAHDLLDIRLRQPAAALQLLERL